MEKKKASVQVSCSAESEKLFSVFFSLYALRRGCVILLITLRVLLCIRVFCAGNVLLMPTVLSVSTVTKIIV